MMLCFVKGGGCRQEVWRPSETAWGRVGEEIPWTSQESGQGEPVGGKIGIWLEWNSFIFTFPEPVLHISHPHWCDFSVFLSLVPLYSDLNEMFY